MANGKRILHIDDDKDILGVAARILEFSGFRVRSLQSDSEITPQMWTEVDLLIIDWMLPGTNGLKIYDRARANGFRGESLLLTARDIVGAERLQVSERNIHYMRKPFGPASLIAIVTRIFAKT